MNIDKLLPISWIKVELGEVIDIQGGSQPPKSHFIYEPKPDYVQLLQIRDFGSKPLPTYIPINEAKKFCKKDDILIARYGASLGRIVTGLCGSYNVALAKVICDTNSIYKKYLFYLLKTSIFQSPLSLLSRSAQNGFAKHEIAHFKLPISPYAEQHQIVSKIEELFSELDNAIQTLKKAREQLKTYRQSVLKHAFEGKLTEEWRKRQKEAGSSPESADKLLERIKKEREEKYQKQLEDWKKACEQAKAEGKKKPARPKKPKDLELLTEEELVELPELPEGWRWEKLGNLSDIVGGVTKGRKFDGKETTDLPYLRVANVQDGYLDLQDIKTITIPEEEEGKYLLQYGDLLYTEGGDKDKLGRGTIWKNQIERCIHQNHIFRARLVSNYLLSLYFAYYTSSITAKNYFFSNAKQTVNLASINITILSNLPVPIPYIEEQQQIVSEIESRLSVCDQLEQSIDDSLNKTGSLRQSILQKAFSGELTKEWRDEHPELISGENSAEMLLERIKAEKQNLKAKDAQKK